MITVLPWSSILECIMGPVSCWTWTNSAYVCIAWIWHVLLQYEVIIILSSSCAVQIYYNGDHGGSTLIFVGWMYVMGVVLTLNKQHVRLCNYMRAQIGMCYCYSMCTDAVYMMMLVISSILLSKYTTYCRLGHGWMKREYVCIALCLNLTRVIAVRCSMRP